jgi:hypothetical protein
MNRSSKEVLYGRLLSEHNRLSNEIAEIKGSSIEITKEQNDRIQYLQTMQLKIVGEIKKMLGSL